MTNGPSARFEPFEEKMRREGVEGLAIEAFRSAYAQLAAGGTGLIPREAIDPVESVPDIDDWPTRTESDSSILASTAVIKLNGGLGTSMGLEGAKSLIEVKDGLSFLDVTARQLLSYQSRFGVAIPLLLMNSYNTDADSMAALKRYPGLVSDLPLRFLQHRVPKVDARDLTPVHWSAQPELEWCPPGHGDIYAALVTSGVLPLLLARGVRYAFVSNIDNLGAVLDARIPLFMREQGVDFLMEVADRTPSDRKGGHLARGKDGRLLLRESAQCPAEEMEDFQDIATHRYFNTNSLWIDLRALSALLERQGGILALPLIRNAKTVDPCDPASPPVYQLETAMGSAISLFEHAAALRVPRSRFAPVKTTDDLLGLWSDAFILTEEFQIVPHPERRGEAPLLRLDPNCYRFLGDARKRFPHGAPSLLHCNSLRIDGDVTFGADVVVRGDVHLSFPAGEQHRIPDGALIES